jgi:ABC-type branched-subunit amino acid transport system substrate-binding protein
LRNKVISTGLAALLCLVLIISCVACSTAPAPTQPAPAASTTPAATSPAKTASPAPATILRIGVMGGLTGPAAPAVNAIMTEFQYVFKYMNETEGGIGGTKLDWKIVDNKGTPDGAVTSYKELRDGYKPHIYIAIEDYYMMGLRDTFAEDKATVIVASSLDSRMFVPPGRVFSVSIASVDGFAALSDWIVKDWKGTGRPKIGMLHIDLPSGLTWKPAENFVKSRGLDVAATAPYSMAALDVKPQLMTLRDAGVNYIWIQATTPSAGVIIRDFRSLGLADKIKPVFNEWTESDKVIELAGEAAEGFYQYRSESPAADGSEAAKLWSKIWKANTGKDRWCDNRLTMNIKAVLAAAVKRTVADAGADKISGETLYNSLTKLTNIDTAGNCGTLGFSDTRRMGVSTMKVSQYTKTDVRSISDWITLPRIFEGIDK